MKVTTTLLVSLACLTYFAAGSPLQEPDRNNTGGAPIDEPDRNNTGGYGDDHSVEKTSSSGYETWYCVKKGSNGNRCVYNSMEQSPCQRGGKYMGCDSRRQHCWGCSVNNNKDYMWNQMSNWCRGKGGYMEKSKGNWRAC